jgi:hypothetical protein
MLSEKAQGSKRGKESGPGVSGLEEGSDAPSCGVTTLAERVVLASPLPCGGGAQGGRGRDWHRATEIEECFLGVVGGVGLECERKGVWVPLAQEKGKGFGEKERKERDFRRRHQGEEKSRVVA